MPIITKIVIGTVVKFGAKKLTTKAVGSAAKMKVNSARLRAAQAFLKKNADLIGDIVGHLSYVGTTLAGDWGGKDYDVHSAAHKELCDACRQMQECINSCGGYLDAAATEYDAAQEASKSKASGLKTAK